jgi:hypothetical protein
MEGGGVEGDKWVGVMHGDAVVSGKRKTRILKES